MKMRMAVLVLILIAIPLVGCFNNNESSDAYDRGYSKGYSVGYESGYSKGYTAAQNNYGGTSSTSTNYNRQQIFNDFIKYRDNPNTFIDKYFD